MEGVQGFQEGGPEAPLLDRVKGLGGSGLKMLTVSRFCGGVVRAGETSEEKEEYI